MAGVKGMHDKRIKSPAIAEKFRSSIRVGLIRNRLMKHIIGELQMTPTQVRAAGILLSKAVPNLSNVEHSGEVTHSYVAAMPEVAPSTTEWQKQHAPQTVQ